MSCPCTTIRDLDSLMGLSSLSDQTDAQFLAALKLVLSHEGGRVDNKRDPGGRTAFGITQRTFTAWLKRQGRKNRDVFTITAAERTAIYYEIYVAAGCLGLPLPLAVIHFDTAVNFGLSAAKTMLAQCGYSVTAYDALRRRRRSDLIARNPSLKAFANGWMRRDTTTLEYAMNVAGAGSSKTTKSTIKPEWG